MADRRHGDQAVELVSHGVARIAAAPIDARSLFEVREAFEPEDRKADQLRADLHKRRSGRGSGEHLHQHHLRDREVSPLTKQGLERLGDGMAALSEELDPGRRVHDDQMRGYRVPRIFWRSPSQPMPSSSSKPRGS